MALLELAENHLTLLVMAYPQERQTGGEGADLDRYRGDRYVLRSGRPTCQLITLVIFLVT